MNIKAYLAGYLNKEAFVMRPQPAATKGAAVSALVKEPSTPTMDPAKIPVKNPLVSKLSLDKPRDKTQEKPKEEVQKSNES